MFHGTVDILHAMDWDRSNVSNDRRMLAESLKGKFQTLGRLFRGYATEQSSKLLPGLTKH
jgi:hypothetical protein